MDRWLLFGVLSLVALLSVPASASADPALPDGFSKVTVAKGMWDATAFAYTPDGRVIIVEKRGRVAVAHPGVSQTTKTVVDIGSHVAVDGDRGLLGVAVDPQPDTDGNLDVYLLYTYDDGSGLHEPKTSRLTRIKLKPDDAVVNPANPETVLLGSIGTAPCPQPDNTVDCIPSNSDSHSIGTVRMAPDRTLWVGSGDGQKYNTADPLALRTFDETSMSGKILHIDRNGHGLPDHPFCPGETDLTKVCTKLFAKGFRNPFRFQLRGGTDPVVGDVGWNTTEEIDLTGSGRSYGWPCWEGPDHTPGYSDFTECAPHYSIASPPDTGPAYSYLHPPGGGGGAIVVGPQVTTARYPAAWRNTWFVGDYVQGWLQAYTITDGKITNLRDFAPTGFDGVDLELTPEGDLAYMHFTDGSINTSRLEQIVYTGNHPPPAVAHATPTTGSAPLPVAFSADVSVDPDGDAVTYDWDFGDGSAHATTRTANHTYSASGAYTATLTVRDSHGAASEDSVQILVDRSAPVATIVAPKDESLFRHGVPVHLQGTGTDADDGTLPESAFAWHILLHHGSHTHIGGDLSGREAQFTPPGDHDADSYYVITLTVTDSDGASDSKTVTIRPETVPFTLASSPAGVPLSYSGTEHVAPVALTSAIGYHTTISAPPQITRGGKTWTFAGWSDGAARAHEITIPATASTVTATFKPPPTHDGGGPATLPPPTVTPPVPRLRLDRTARRTRVLSGRITGVATAPVVRIALRTASSHGRCRHWNQLRGRLGKASKHCSRRVWMRAAVTAGPSGWRWRVRLHGPLRRGRYVVASSVTDKRGRALLVAAPIRRRIR
jgi:PKD repeat protein/glucose/arabinose dehydrogenase